MKIWSAKRERIRKNNPVAMESEKDSCSVWETERGEDERGRGGT